MLRIIIAAMAGGILTFAAVVVSLVQGRQLQPDVANAETLLLLLAAVGVSAVGTYIPARQAQLARLRRDALRDDFAPARVIATFKALTILGGALAEGFSLFGIVVYLLTANALALIAPALGLLVLAALFPSRQRLGNFVSGVLGKRGEP